MSCFFFVFFLACLRALTDHIEPKGLGGFSPGLMILLSQTSWLQNKRRKQLALQYISVFEFLWFIIQLPPNMFQLGSDFCWGLAAAVANRQSNIYILLSSGKQTPFWGSAVWAVKSLYLCTCLHNSYDIFMVNQCKFHLNRDPAAGLSGDKVHTHKVQRDKSNNLFFLHKGLWNRGGHPLVKMASCMGYSQWGHIWRPHVIGKQQPDCVATE